MFKVVDAPEIPKVDLGCGFGDFFCSSNEWFAQQMALTVSEMSKFVLGDRDIHTGSSLWDAAIGQASYWWGYVIIVMLIASTTSLAIALIRADTRMIRRVLLGILLSVPSTIFAIFILGEALRVTDEISAGILDWLGGDGGFANLIAALMKPTGEGGVTISPVVGGGSTILSLNLIIMLIALLVIMVALSFRNLVLMLLIAFAPLAFMLLPASGGEAWVRRWASAVVAMLLAKPILFGTLQLIMRGFGETNGITDPATLVLAIGLLLVGFMPLMIYGFFQFVGGGAGGDSVGTAAAQKASGASRQAQHVVTRGIGSTRSVNRTSSVQNTSKPATTATPQSSSTQASTAGGRPGAGAGARATFEQPKPRTPSVPKAPK